MKKLLSLITALSLFALVGPILALEVTQIGVSYPTDQSFTTWQVSSENPVMAGTAAAGSAMTLDVNGTVFNFSADGSGNWTYQPTSLTTGTHTLTLADALESKTFTLTVGAASSTNTTSVSESTTSGTLPTAGVVENTIMLLGLGTILVLGGWKLSKQTA